MILFFGLKIMIKKNLRPTDIDAHIKYQCPKCGIQHWISLKEAKTKNFKVVCDCDTVFKPKQIERLKIIYSHNKKPKKEDSQEILVPGEILNKCSSILITYGFTKQEADNMIKKAYIQNQTNDCVQLIKYTLETLGVNNEQYQTNIV